MRCESGEYIYYYGCTFLRRSFFWNLTYSIGLAILTAGVILCFLFARKLERGSISKKFTIAQSTPQKIAPIVESSNTCGSVFPSIQESQNNTPYHASSPVVPITDEPDIKIYVNEVGLAFCTHCGNDVQPDALVCPYCGESLK